MNAREEALAQLVTLLNAWHDAAGRPSTRQTAEDTGNSHTTVASTLSGRRVPGWARLERIVRYLGGDTAQAHALWRTYVQLETGPGTLVSPEEQRERVKNALETAKSVLDEVIGLPMTGPERDYESRSRLRAAVLPVLLRDLLDASR